MEATEPLLQVTSESVKFSSIEQTVLVLRSPNLIHIGQCFIYILLLYYATNTNAKTIFTSSSK